MAIDGVSPSAIAVAAASVAYRWGKIIFELASVRTQINELQGTIDQVVSEIEYARQLRKYKAKLLDIHEKTKIDETIKSTTEAVRRVQVLVEAARVDMDVNWGKISSSSRVMWVMDGNSKVPTVLALLTAHKTTLSSLITIMSLKAGGLSEFEDEDPPPPPEPYSGLLRRRATTLDQNAVTDDGDNGFDNGDDLPPSYDQALKDALHRMRQSNSRSGRSRLLLQTPIWQQTATTSFQGPCAPNLNDVSTFFAEDATMRSSMIGVQLDGRNQHTTLMRELDGAVQATIDPQPVQSTTTSQNTRTEQPVDATLPPAIPVVGSNLTFAPQPGQRQPPNASSSAQAQLPSPPAAIALSPQTTGDVVMRSRAAVSGHRGSMTLEWFEPSDFSRLGRSTAHGSSSTRDSSSAPLLGSSQAIPRSRLRRGDQRANSWLRWAATQRETPTDDLYDA